LGPKNHVLQSFVCKKIRSKAKTRNFRTMFHAEPTKLKLRTRGNSKQATCY
jgi:hypothetical protein